MAVRVSCGRDLHYCPDINTSVESATKDGFDFVCIPMVHPRYKREFIEGGAKSRQGPLTRSDLLLTSTDWGSLIVGKISPWIDLDSEVESTRKNSEKAFQEELAFAAHLTLPAVLMKLKHGKCVNAARFLNEHVTQGPNQQFWVQVPMRSPAEVASAVFQSQQTDEETTSWEDDTWKWWDLFRTICDTSKKIGLALELSADLPDEAVLRRWCGENIKAAILPTSIFLTNKKGFPVLSKGHQNFVKKLFDLDVQLIISGVVRHPEKGIRPYYQYMEHIFASRDPPDTVSAFAKGYEDFLQCPLQPLMDNLESQTYETFEKDPVKYSQYQKAIYYALLDRVLPEEKDSKVTILMVVGAGRGPLVRAAITAAKNADRQLRIYAVEKNPNAVVTLENLKAEMWGNQVTVVSCDMREWEAPEKADILVSELLGSFSDNELSPECLDGAQRFLKEDGISIPCEYTSYLNPLQSAKLYNEVRQCREKDKHPEAPFETPYVVRLHNVFNIADCQSLFTFVHPNRGLIDNTRYKSLQFSVTQDCVLHGFGGYFDTRLYGDVTLSITPETHSPGMFSWFPIFFPIKNPIHLVPGDVLEVHFWRRVTQKNVWYEWCVTKPHPQPVHNTKGRSYFIGL
ncbi:protein arginine N-methyltransferase 5 [Lingula anatina]|uniref:Protein arginine N-methyltransferase n=1 Tax=Lingula anatina TaxID=7574 RepID=A0A1S3H7V5_LINAN|nr:protein arginine N-methyltransferase 5 [Lingula anatina]|eukprot:XP_013381204.1 protein arginine N-methyltransferase 5 [Lingula anatina]